MYIRYKNMKDIHIVTYTDEFVSFLHEIFTKMSNFDDFYKLRYSYKIFISFFIYLPWISMDFLQILLCFCRFCLILHIFVVAMSNLYSFILLLAWKILFFIILSLFSNHARLTVISYFFIIIFASLKMYIINCWDESK